MVMRDRYPALPLNSPPPQKRERSRLIKLSQAREHARKLKSERDGEDPKLVIVWLAYDGRYDVIDESRVRRTTHVVEYV